jgi:amidase
MAHDEGHKLVKTLKKDRACYSISADNPPQLHVVPGEVFCLETEDCYSGNLRTSTDRFTKDMWDTVNPATGPVYIDGAAVGDALCVDIESIETRNYAVMCVEHGAGALAEQIEGIETSILPIVEGKLVVNEHLAIPVRPMIGVIGVAPQGAGVPTGTPGEHGGNMDCREIGAGASVYLPVAVEGALLVLGDIHAVMGDGEVCICGAEVSGRITLRTRLISNRDLPTPCVETAESLLILASAKTLDDCQQMVLEKAHRFLTRVLHLPANESARAMSLLGQLGVCQVVDPLKTMKFVFPKRELAALDGLSELRKILRPG